MVVLQCQNLCIEFIWIGNRAFHFLEKLMTEEEKRPSFGIVKQILLSLNEVLIRRVLRK